MTYHPSSHCPRTSQCPTRMTHIIPFRGPWSQRSIPFHSIPGYNWDEMGLLWTSLPSQCPTRMIWDCTGHPTPFPPPPPKSWSHHPSRMKWGLPGTVPTSDLGCSSHPGWCVLMLYTQLCSYIPHPYHTMRCQSQTNYAIKLRKLLWLTS